MDRAISIFLGIFVFPDECDRSTYEKRALACPLCGAGVFWASGEHQKPHFRHFPGEGDPSCEQRSQHMHPEEWVRKERAAEQQLYRRLTKRFWGLFTGVYAQMQWDHVEAELNKNRNNATEMAYETLHLDATGVGKAIEAIEDKKRRLGVHGFVYLTMFVQQTLDAKDLTLRLLDTMYQSILRHAPDAQAQLGSYAAEAEMISKTARQRSQLVSTRAALEFLFQPRNREMLEIIAAYLFADYGIQHEESPLEFPLIGEENSDVAFVWILSALIGLLLSVPWAKAAKAMEDTGSIPESMQHVARIRPTNVMDMVSKMPPDVRSIYNHKRWIAKLEGQAQFNN